MNLHIRINDSALANLFSHFKRIVRFANASRCVGGVLCKSLLCNPVYFLLTLSLTYFLSDPTR